MVRIAEAQKAPQAELDALRSVGEPNQPAEAAGDIEISSTDDQIERGGDIGISGFLDVLPDEGLFEADLSGIDGPLIEEIGVSDPDRWLADCGVGHPVEDWLFDAVTYRPSELRALLDDPQAFEARIVHALSSAHESPPGRAEMRRIQRAAGAIVERAEDAAVRAVANGIVERASAAYADTAERLAAMNTDSAARGELLARVASLDSRAEIAQQLQLIGVPEDERGWLAATLEGLESDEVGRLQAGDFDGAGLGGIEAIVDDGLASTIDALGRMSESLGNYEQRGDTLGVFSAPEVAVARDEVFAEMGIDLAAPSGFERTLADRIEREAAGEDFEQLATDLARHAADIFGGLAAGPIMAGFDAMMARDDAELARAAVLAGTADGGLVDEREGTASAATDEALSYVRENVPPVDDLLEMAVDGDFDFESMIGVPNDEMSAISDQIGLVGDTVDAVAVGRTLISGTERVLRRDAVEQIVADEAVARDASALLGE